MEKTDPVFQYGSRWFRADFHLHTPADKEFSYMTTKASEYPPEHTFPSDYIGALKKAGIQIGVITNHNKFDKGEFDCLRKKARKENIFLLPGIELSAGDGAHGVHALIVFSDEWIANGNDYITPFVTSVFPGKTSAECGNENARCDKTVLQLIRELDKTGRDYFIIFAHVEETNGLWKELDGGRLRELFSDTHSRIREKVLGFQKVRTEDVPDRMCRKKFRSLVTDWYPAEVEGSDCKSLDEIGTKNGETWLKTGTFSFEAVKYALIDYDSRIRNFRPEKLQHSFIKSISFTGGILNEKTVCFSPELNTLIGIRGSGKSSIIEAIRYTLDIPFGDKVADREYKDGLVAYVLGSGGTAEIIAVDKFGTEFTVRRVLHERPEVFQNDILQPGVSIRETVIHKPVYFGQKDLSASGEGFEKDLVEKLLGDSLVEVRRSIEEQKQKVGEAVAALQKTETTEEKIEQYTKEKQDAEFNLQKFAAYGIEEKLKKQTDFDADDRKLQTILSDSESFIFDWEDLIAAHEDTIRNHARYVSEQNKDFFEKFMRLYASVVEAVDRQKTDCAETSTAFRTLEGKYKEFLELKKKFQDEFAATRRTVTAEIQTGGSIPLNLEEYPELKKRIATATAMLEALDKQRKQKNDLNKNLLCELSELNNLYNQEFQLIQKQLDIINGDNSSLHIDAEYKGEKAQFLAFMKSMFRGSHINETTFAGLTERYADFSEIYKDFDNACSHAGYSPETFKSYFTENLSALLQYQVPNKFTIMYKGKELKSHSLGQRASALIIFVLSRKESDVVIVDQPEDDLDNQTIYQDVIRLIRQCKPDTQFIFATHNANFPVLGDAEQIHACSVSENKIQMQSGSVDDPAVQQKIVDIMEGGKEAFERRKEIYESWKLRN